MEVRIPVAGHGIWQLFRFWTTFMFASILHCGRCELMANSSLSVTSNVPAGYGWWRLNGNCDFRFPGKNIEAADVAHVFTRFGVAVKNGSYTDNLLGIIKNRDLNGHWLVTSVGFPTSNEQLAYTVEFEYDEYLGTAAPDMDCFLFTTVTEALAMSLTSSVLYTPLADPLLALCPMEEVFSYKIKNVDEQLVNFRCQFDFPNLRHGEFEAWIFLNFSVPITAYTDNFGGDNISISADKTWVIVRYPFSARDSCTPIGDIHVSSAAWVGVQGVWTATCRLYMTEAAVIAYAAITPEDVKTISKTTTTSTPIDFTKSIYSKGTTTAAKETTTSTAIKATATSTLPDAMISSTTTISSSTVLSYFPSLAPKTTTPTLITSEVLSTGILLSPTTTTKLPTTKLFETKPTLSATTAQQTTPTLAPLPSTTSSATSEPNKKSSYSSHASSPLPSTTSIFNLLTKEPTSTTTLPPQTTDIFTTVTNATPTPTTSSAISSLTTTSNASTQSPSSATSGQHFICSSSLTADVFHMVLVSILTTPGLSFYNISTASSSLTSLSVSAPIYIATAPTLPRGDRFNLVEVTRARDREINGTVIWSIESPAVQVGNIIQCGRKCLAFRACAAIAVNSISGLCKGLASVISSDQSDNGLQLYTKV